MSRSAIYTSSPLLASKTPVWRSKFIVAAIALGFLGLAGRAVFLQVFSSKFYQDKGVSRFARTLPLPAKRGRILDRNGAIIASSVQVQNLWMTPEDAGRERPKPPGTPASGAKSPSVSEKTDHDLSMQQRLTNLLDIVISGVMGREPAKQPDATASKTADVRDEVKLQKLASLLDMPWAEFQKKLEHPPKPTTAGKSPRKSFIAVKYHLDDAVAKQVAALDIYGIHLRPGYKRKYPEGEALAHVVGFTNVVEVGVAGMELALNKDLTGQAGSRYVIRDKGGRVVEEVGDDAPPIDGQDISLSIDSRVQFFAYEKLRAAVLENKAKAGSVVVLDSVTGEVLALANYPSYVPENRQNLTGDALRNRALTDMFEPGSTMKPITVAMALEAGRIKPQTLVDTHPGRYSIGGFTISDTHNYGQLTVEGVIQKSSNVGALKIAQKMSPKEMWDTYTALGYGQKPQVQFPGVVPGRLRPWKVWRPVEQATMSYGYGLLASLFQMAHSYTAFAHDGQIIPLTMLRSSQPAVGTRVFSPQNAAAVRKMLQMAAGPGGTGQKAQTEGYSVGGKSGTAHKQVGKGYASNKYRAWFTGMAPIDKPRIIVAVMIDEPSAGQYYGGAVAAPVFSEVVQQTLRLMAVPPDMAVKPRIVIEAAEESF